jgi:hypothetical protein
MRFGTSVACAVFAAATLALLEGCAGTNTIAGAPAVPPSIAGQPRAAGATAAASKALVYAENYPSQVEVFDLGSYKTPLDTITNGISQPSGEAVDSRGNLYVADQGSEVVEAYAPGTSTPFATYGQGSYYGPVYDPYGIAVSKNGTLYVANGCCYDSGFTECVTVFAPGYYRDASGYIYLPNDAQPNYLAIGAKDDLFVTLDRYSSGDVFEFKHGQEPGIDLALKGLKSAAGIAIDGKGDLVIADPSNGVIDVFPPKAREYARQIKVAAGEPVGIAFTSDYKSLFASIGAVDGNSTIFQIVDYATGKLRTVLKRGCTSWCSGSGIALSPAAQP